MRISDWSSDVCSSDLLLAEARAAMNEQRYLAPAGNNAFEFYLRVLEKDPGNKVASDALREGSEERRVGNECVSTCRSRWAPYPTNKTKSTRATVENNTALRRSESPEEEEN